MTPTNEANRDALDSLIREYMDGRLEIRAPYALAEWLASRGVLVPSVLTVQQISSLYDVPEGENYRAYRVRDLEAVAKGEFRDGLASLPPVEP